VAFDVMHVRTQLLLNSLFDVIEHRYQLCVGANKNPGLRPSSGIPSVQDAYTFHFHCQRDGTRATGSNIELAEFKHVVRVPSMLDAQTRLLGERGSRSAPLRAQWLDLGVTTLRRLLTHVQAPSAAHIALHESVESLLDGLPRAAASKKKQRARLFAAVRPQAPTVDYLRENLVRWSPLQQGKRDAFPTPGPLPVATPGSGYAAESPSLFSARVRRERLGSLHSQGCFVAETLAPGRSVASGRAGVPATDGSAHAVARLVDFMYRHYDRLCMYHDVWYTISVRVGDHPFLCTAKTRSFFVPADFKEWELDAFIRKHGARSTVSAALRFMRS
jgi:hypothetical protein